MTEETLYKEDSCGSESAIKNKFYVGDFISFLIQIFSDNYIWCILKYEVLLIKIDSLVHGFFSSQS